MWQSPTGRGKADLDNLTVASAASLCVSSIGLIVCCATLQQRKKHTKQVQEHVKQVARRQEEAAREAARRRSESLRFQREFERIRYLDMHSSALSLLSELNVSYGRRFYPLESMMHFRVKTQSKNGFDSFSPTKFLRAQIKRDFDRIANTLYYVASNRDNYRLYQAELQRIHTMSVVPSKLPTCFSSVEDYRKREDELFEAKQLHPTASFSIRVHWGYTSPKRHNSYNEYRDYNEEQTKRLLREVSREMGRRTVDQQAASYQRSLVTPSLRIKVFKRDGYRCQICGRSAKEDGVALEVDHIVPVSKGGKTELSNL